MYYTGHLNMRVRFCVLFEQCPNPPFHHSAVFPKTVAAEAAEGIQGKFCFSHGFELLWILQQHIDGKVSAFKYLQTSNEETQLSLSGLLAWENCCFYPSAANLQHSRWEWLANSGRTPRGSQGRSAPLLRRGSPAWGQARGAMNVPFMTASSAPRQSHTSPRPAPAQQDTADRSLMDRGRSKLPFYLSLPSAFFHSWRACVPLLCRCSFPFFKSSLKAFLSSPACS